MQNQQHNNAHHSGAAQKSARRNVLIMNICLAILVVGKAYWALNSIKETEREHYKNTLQTVLNTTQEGIERWHAQQIQSIDTIARLPEFQKEVKAQLEVYKGSGDLKQSEALKSLREQIAVFTGLAYVQGFFVIAPDGKSIASMRDSNIGTINIVKQHHPEYFRRARQGEAVMVPPIPSDVPLEGVGNIAGRNVPPTMFFLVPIRRGNSGQVVAILAARVSPVSGLSAITRKGRIGKSGETYLFDEKGMLLSESRFLEDLRGIGFIVPGETSILSVHLKDPGENLVATKTSPKEISPNNLTLMAESATQGNSATNVEGYRDYRGITVIGAWRWLDELNIGITTEIDYDEAMMTYYKVRRALIIILAAILLAAIMLSTLTLRMGTRIANILEKAKDDLEDQVKERTSELQQTQNSLQLVVDNVPAVVFLKDSDGTYLMINKRYTELTGVTADEAIGKKDRDLFPGEIAEKFVEADQTVIRSGVIQDIEEKAPSSEGELRDYWSSKIPLKDEEGKVTALLGTALDITERKRSERMLQETKDFLAYSEARWRAILDNLGDAVITIDQNGCIQTFSQAASEIFGYHADEMTGQKVNRLMPQDIAAVHDGYLKRDIEHGTSSVINNLRTITGVRKSGEEFPIELTITAVPLQGEKIFVGVLRDVTQSHKLQNELIRSKESAEEASRAKSEFLAAMSHEIRTPMNGVLGMLGLLAKTDLSKDQNRKLEIAQSSAQALLTLINDILDFSKVEAGKMELEEVDFNLRNQIESVCQSLAHKVHEKGLEFNLDLTDITQTKVSGDPSRLRQVLINLIGNATKFTSEGEILVRAKLQDLGEKGFRLSCSVIDTGIGIPQDKIGKLFSSFTQVDSSVTRKYGGTGLGLAICKRITELMQGTILVESEEGKGSEFRFSVRLGKASSSEEVLPRSDVADLKILVVDDNQTNREIFQEQLQHWGCLVDEADSADLALDMCRAKVDNGLYDLVLTDMAMPEKNGLDFAKELRSDSRLSDVKLLMMSSVGVAPAELKSLGFSAYFSKPVTTSDLFDALAISAGLESIEHGGVLTKAKLNAMEYENGEQNVRHVWPEGVRILLVEDNQVNQYVAQELLEDFGLSCDVAGNGLEALQSLTLAEQSEPYTIILMDCQMPEMDGYEATRLIRAGEAGKVIKDVPIVAMTANAMQGDKEKCYAAGMNAYLAKPLDADELFSTLKTWLGGEDKVVESKPEKLSENNSTLESNDVPLSKAFKTDEGLNLPAGLKTLDFEKKKPSIARKPAAYIKLLNLYVDNNATFCSQLEEAKKHDDIERVHHLVHALKGSAGNMGMMAVYELAVKVEEALKQESDGVNQALEQFKVLVENSFDDARSIIKVNS